MRTFLTIILLAVTFGCASAAEAPRPYLRDVRKWVEVTPPPKEDANEYMTFKMRANWSTDEWVVSTAEGQVRAVLRTDVGKDTSAVSPAFPMALSIDGTDPRDPTELLRTDDGWLAVYNRGEFGSALWWYASDGTSKYQISKHWVNQLVRYKNRIFAVEGLDHMGAWDGMLMEVLKRDGRWTASKFVDLPGAGLAITLLPDERFCIATSEMLLAVSLQKDMEILIPNGRWNGLYPNSLAVDGDRGSVYIGMRQFVVRYTLGDKTHRIHLLVPGLSFLNKKAY